MQCKNCGATLADGTKFCTSCGAKIEEEVVSYQQPLEEETTVSEQQVAETEETTILEQPPVAEEPELPVLPDFEQPEAPKKKKKKKKGPIVLIIILVVLALLGAGAIAGTLLWRDAFFAIAPENYTLKLVENTIAQIEDESVKAEKNVFGFEVTTDKVLSLVANITDKREDGTTEINFEVANKPSDKELLASAKVKTDNGNTTVQAFLGDTEMGLRLPGSGDSFLTIPSKEFGKEVIAGDSAASKLLSDELYLDKDEKRKLKNLDLSYSNLIPEGSYSAISEALDKYADEAFINLMKNSEFGKRESIKYDFDDKTVNAKEISITIGYEDLIDAYIEVIEAVQNDKDFEEKFGKNTLKALDDLVDDLKDTKKDSDIEEILVVLVEYKAKIAEVRFEYVEENKNYTSEYSVSFRALNKDNILGGIAYESNSEYESNHGDEEYSSSSSDLYEITSNWLDEKNEITFDLNYKSSYKSDSYKNNDSGYAWLTLDFDNGEWEAGVKDSDSKKKQKVSGTLSKKDGFKVGYNTEYNYTDVIEYYESEYDEWLEEWYEEQFDYYSYDYLHEIYDENYAHLTTTKYYRGYYYSYSYEDELYPYYSDWVGTYAYNDYNVNDYRFQEWLLEYRDMDEEALEYLYEEEEHTYDYIDKTAELDVNVTLKNKTDLKVDHKDTDNILKWKKSDFSKFSEAFEEAIDALTADEKEGVVYVSKNAAETDVAQSEVISDIDYEENYDYYYYY